jgi:hypothetical protein
VDYDAATLASLCRPGDVGSAQELQNLICAGYVVGVRDAFNYNTDAVNNIAPKNGRLADPFCPPRGTERGAYIDAFNEYMIANPEMGSGPAAGVVMLAFERKFPCPSKK